MIGGTRSLVTLAALADAGDLRLSELEQSRDAMVRKWGERWVQILEEDRARRLEAILTAGPTSGEALALMVAPWARTIEEDRVRRLEAVRRQILNRIAWGAQFQDVVMRENSDET